MKTKMVILLLCCRLFCAGQDKSHLPNLTFQLNLNPVPITEISGADTSFRNALSVAPAIDFRSKSGLGILYSPSFVTSGSKAGIYLHTVTAGYEKYGGKNFDLALNYSHYFFTHSTSVPYSPISNELYLYFAYSKTWLRPTIAFSYGFGRDSSESAVNDLALAGGLSHIFKWTDKGPFPDMELTPSVLMNLGTNKYFSFLNVSKYISHSHNFTKVVKKGGKNSQARTDSSSPFSVNNIEFNLEGSLEMGRFTARPTGSIFLPVGSDTDNAVYGYWQLTLQYRL